MSLLRDPPTVLGNPLSTWTPSLHHLLCLMILVSDSVVLICGSSLSVTDVPCTLVSRICDGLPWVSLMFRALFNDAVVLRICNCSILLFAYRLYLVLSQKIFKRVFKVLLLLHKKFCGFSDFLGRSPPSGWVRLSLQKLWYLCFSASITRIFPNLMT